MTWMTAVRDHPDKPPAMQVHVLLLLALRMDWSTGCGFASAAQLADDAQVRERTVRNATSWARNAEMLVQSRRGHRLGDGRTVASEWRLTLPISTGTGMPVEEISTGTEHSLNRHETSSQPARGAPPSRTSSSRTSSSASGDGAKAPRTPHTQPASPRRVPPCPECGGPFAAEDLASDSHYAAAMRGDLVHAGCERRS